MELTFTLFCILITVLAAAVYGIRRNQNYWKVRGIAYEEPHLFMGSLRGFRKNRSMCDILLDYYRKFKGTGPFCGFFFFQRPAAFILDTQLAKRILIKDFPNFVNRTMYHNERDDPLTGHLFFLEGNKWKRLRQKLSPTFSSGKMKFMFPTMVGVGEKFVKMLADNVSVNDVVEVKELMARFTTDVIGTCVFGIECNSLKNPNTQFGIMGRRAFQDERHGILIVAFMQSFPELARKMHLRQIPEDIHQFFMRTVRETVDFRERNAIKRNDFMNLLLELKNSKGILAESGEVLRNLSIEEVAAQAFVFFLAGFETSSTAMSFTLYELAKHQDIQQRLRDEINEVLARHDNQLTYEGIKEMRYMEQVLSEILRLYTIIPFLMREAVDDYVVPDHPQYVIEKGTFIVIPSVGYHQDPDLYPNPEVFNPDNFTPERVAQRDPAEWLPFGDGPRNCIGLRFGKMQASIGLALLLKNFKFSVCPQTPTAIEYNPKSIALNVMGGIYLNAVKV